MGHKHSPVGGCGLVRFWKFLFKSRRLIDWKAETSCCHECGALIRVPKAINAVGIFLPFICIPSTFLCFTVTVYNFNLPEYLKVAIGVIMLVFFTLLSNALLNSLAMTFGRWVIVEIGEQSVENVKQQLRKEVNLRKKQPSNKRLAVAVIIITILTYVGTLALMLVITSS